MPYLVALQVPGSIPRHCCVAFVLLLCCLCVAFVLLLCCFCVACVLHVLCSSGIGHGLCEEHRCEHALSGGAAGTGVDSLLLLLLNLAPVLLFQSCSNRSISHFRPTSLQIRVISMPGLDAFIKVRVLCWVFCCVVLLLFTLLKSTVFDYHYCQQPCSISRSSSFLHTTLSVVLSYPLLIIHHPSLIPHPLTLIPQSLITPQSKNFYSLGDAKYCEQVEVVLGRTLK
jgi:hypothetical protein